MINDFKYALRSFMRTPGFTVVAILTLALGIGATTAMFSVVNAVLLRPLPYLDPDRLVSARGSLADFRDFDGANQSFEQMGFWASNRYNVRVGNDSHQIVGAMVSRTLLPMLGVQPLLGRNFNEADEQQDTVILGYGLWHSRFGGDPAVLGRTVDLSGITYTVVGVAPAWFRFPAAEFEVWVPIASIDRLAPAQAKNRAFRIFTAVARLRAGVTLQQAQAEAAAFSSRLEREFPATNAGVSMALEPLYERLVGAARPPLQILLGTVALLLLIACANVANLLLARTTVREREMAIRAALGAGRGRLVRQLLTESVMLAAAGGALGLLVTMWGIDLLPAALEARLPRADGIKVDGAVFAFTLGATVLTGLFFGLAPAFQTAADSSASLKESGRGVSAGSRGRRLRRGIAIVETALAVIVLVGAGLLVRSFLSLTARDPGFDPARLLSFNVQFVALPDAAARAQAAAQLMDTLGQLPGVETAGAATGLPSGTPQRSTRFAIEGGTLTASQDSAHFIAATPDYFEALGTPVLQGRAIDRHDTSGAAPVVVINRRLANQLFPNQDPVGQRLKLVNPEQSGEWRTVVGVVGDVKYQGLADEAAPAVYTPFAQTPFMWLYVQVRTASDLEPLMRTLRAAVPTVHPSLTAGNLKPMAEVLAQSVAEPRFNMMLVGGFAGLALMLSALGVYGVIAYSVAQRTREIGVRMALGAGRRDVLRLVIGEGLGMAIAGVTLGLLGAAALARVMAGLLFGITPRDPVTYAAGAAALLAVSLIASYIPARRATRVEPVTALRAD